MKSIKKLVLLFSFLMFAACVQEQTFENVSGGYSVTLNVRSGMYSPSTYASVPALEEEYNVSELQALFFDADNGDRYMGHKKIDMSGAQMTPDHLSKYDKGFTVNFDMRGVLYDSNGSSIPVRELNGKNVKFVFVANLTEEKMLEMLRSIDGISIYTKNISEIKKAIVSSDISANKFVMLGLGTDKEPVSGTLQKAVSISLPAVELERLAAKISVSVGDVQSHPLNDGLVITKVTMKNRIKSSFLFEKGGNAVSYSESKEDKEYDGDFDKLYTYENSSAGNTNSTYLSVELTLNGRTLKPVEVPFNDKAIKRNYIYRVTLNRDKSDGKEGNNDDVIVNPPVINFTIDVNDWEKDYMYYQDYRDQSNSIITEITGYNADWTAPLSENVVAHVENKKNNSESEVVINTFDKYNLLVKIKSISTQLEPVISEKDKDWIKVEDITTYSQNYGMHQVFQVSLAPSFYTNRMGTIEFINKINPAVKCLLHLRTRHLVPIDFVADYNVAENRAFEMTFANNVQKTYSSEKLSNVCPEGWHVPTSAEIRAVVNGEYDRFQRYVSYSTTKSFDNVEESISWSNYPIRSYLSDYRNTQGITYALRFKNSDICCAYRYEKEGSWNAGEQTSSLKVTVRYIGKDDRISVDQIANEKYWNTNSGGDVIKRFPLKEGKSGSYILDEPRTELSIYPHSAYVQMSFWGSGCIRPFKNSSLNENPEEPKSLKIKEVELIEVESVDNTSIQGFNYESSISPEGDRIKILFSHAVKGVVALTLENPIDKEIWRKNNYVFNSWDYSNHDVVATYLPKFNNKVYLNFSTQANNRDSYLSLRNSNEKIYISISKKNYVNTSFLRSEKLYISQKFGTFYPSYWESMAGGARLATKEEALCLLPSDLTFSGNSGHLKVKERVRLDSETKEYEAEYDYRISTSTIYGGGTHTTIEVKGKRFIDGTKDKVCFFQYSYDDKEKTLSIFIKYAGPSYETMRGISYYDDQGADIHAESFQITDSDEMIMLKGTDGEYLGWNIDKNGMSFRPSAGNKKTSIAIMTMKNQ